MVPEASPDYSKVPEMMLKMMRLSYQNILNYESVICESAEKYNKF